MANIESVYWFQMKEGSDVNNAGDDVTPYLYEKITGKKPKRVNPGNCNDVNVVGCGSVLAAAGKNSIVWGTGSMFPNPIKTKIREVRAVRGPLTRETILKSGGKCPPRYGDPGLLMPLFFRPNIKPIYKVGVLPHYSDDKYIRELVSKIEGVRFIDIVAPLEQVISEILECESMMSSSLHGIIFSHAYSIPCAWFDRIILHNVLKNHYKFKYHDYYGSRNITPYPKPISPNVLKNHDVNSLYKLIMEYPQPTEPYDTNILMEVCPFKPSS